jgi:hypothetical protein
VTLVFIFADNRPWLRALWLGIGVIQGILLFIAFLFAINYWA